MKILICIALVAALILFLNLLSFYRKQKCIDNILYAWKNRVYKGNITFDGHEKFKNDYYLSFQGNHNFFTHIHFITDQPSLCYLCYLVKVNNKHSEIYMIDIDEDPDKVINEMLENYQKMSRQ